MALASQKNEKHNFDDDFFAEYVPSLHWTGRKERVYYSAEHSSVD